MCQSKIIRRRGALYIYSFTTGVQPVTVPVRTTEDDVMAELMRLVRNGKAEEAELLLERYCSTR
jgi:NifB/MoaA-like Fe-S oxidoreductase